MCSFEFVLKSHIRACTTGGSKAGRQEQYPGRSAVLVFNPSALLISHGIDAKTGGGLLAFIHVPCDTLRREASPAGQFCAQDKRPVLSSQALT
jgi:hypothetical protein